MPRWVSANGSIIRQGLRLNVGVQVARAIHRCELPASQKIMRESSRRDWRSNVGPAMGTSKKAPWLLPGSEFHVPGLRKPKLRGKRDWHSELHRFCRRGYAEDNGAGRGAKAIDDDRFVRRRAISQIDLHSADQTASVIGNPNHRMACPRARKQDHRCERPREKLHASCPSRGDAHSEDLNI